MSYNVFVHKTTDQWWNYVQNFYNTFPHDYNLDVTLPICVISTSSMLELLVELNKCPNENVLIVSHSHPKIGLTSYHLPPSITIPQFEVIGILLTYIKIINKLDIIEKDNWPFINSPRKGIDLLKEIPSFLNFKTIPQTLNMITGVTRSSLYGKSSKRYEQLINEYNEIVSKNPLAEDEQKRKAEEILQTVTGQINKVLKGLKQMSQLTDEDFEKFITQIINLHNKKRKIEIRGCRIGQNKKLLEILCYFFNAQSIRTPKCRIIFGEAGINVIGDQKELNRLMKEEAISYIGRKQIKSGCTNKGCYWIGGKTRRINRNNIIRQGYYYHPKEEAMINEDELLFLNEDELLFLKKGLNFKIVAEHINIVKKFAVLNFGEPKIEITDRMTMLPVELTENKPFRFPRDPNFGIQCEFFPNPEKFSL
jgi:hypothetical protein